HANKPSQVGEHTILNEGIKLSAIAAHLEQVVQTGNGAAAPAREVLRIFNGIDEELGFFGTLGRTSPSAGSELEAVVNGYSGEQQDIDVGFWNVEWLSNRWEAKTKDVARVIHTMNLDLWSLEESSPSAAEALVAELRDTYGHDYDWAAAEPDAPDSKQSCTIIWNTETVDCKPEDWGEPIETWLRTKSRDFDDLGFEAVHGKIFNRYPRLFKVTARQQVAGASFDFYLVPLHLKAKNEGSMRRRLASQILAAAVQRKIDDGADADWMIGGDVNAELGSGDFANMISGGLTPVSAKDESQGAFTYLKYHKSLIDHIFLSPNMSQRFGADSFFIVAADRELPDFVSKVSDHRPVLLRMSLSLEGEETDNGESGALAELLEILDRRGGTSSSAVSPCRSAQSPDLQPKENESSGFEAGRTDFSNRAGFDVSFLGGSQHHVPLPVFSSVVEEQAVIVNSSADGADRFRLDYMHFSVAMNGQRRFPIYSAVNIDGTQLRGAPRKGWKFDSRIDKTLQAGNDVYKHNDLDKGHMTRRLDPVWGTPHVADIANRDSMFYTNAVPQHKDLNQKDWVQLEDYVLENSKAHDLKVSVMTGPVFGANDRPYRSILLPEEFWKVVVMRRNDTEELSASGYILTQKDLVSGFEFIFGEFKTYQVTLSQIESRTGLNFGRLKEFDPKARMGGFEAMSGPTELSGPDSLTL
ncbi:MAG: DNA/RNA endonuclease G (NUC1), partial [Verrucomicrobiales bacterium]